MGIVLTTLLTGLKKSHPLVDASTLCGACNEVCPVKIPLAELILKQRVNRVSEGLSPSKINIGMGLFQIATKSSFLFSLGERLANMFWPIMRMFGGKNVVGRLPHPAKTAFRRRFK